MFISPKPSKSAEPTKLLRPVLASTKRAATGIFCPKGTRCPKVSRITRGRLELNDPRSGSIKLYASVSVALLEECGPKTLALIRADSEMLIGEEYSGEALVGSDPSSV